MFDHVYMAVVAENVAEFNCADIFFEGVEPPLMGAPKQKWTAEEEAALKAGVLKHGTGKWRTILMDPEFSSILRLRSNVDLKVFMINNFSMCIHVH